jgi:hypothetical protein
MDAFPVREPLEGDRQIEQLIHPTGHCFDDALEILVQLLTEEHVPPAKLLLVHGICLMDDNCRFAHAWVEQDGQCLFLGRYQGDTVLCTVDRADFYRRLRVQERTKYTPQQAARENERTCSYGPWKPRYLALTRPGEEAHGDTEPLHLV